MNTHQATFWTRGQDPCLSLNCTSDQFSAMRFTREPSGAFTVSTAVTQDPLSPKSHQTRFERTSQDIWAPFSVKDGQTVTSTLDLKQLSYKDTYGRGDFKGLDTGAITEMVNTIGRIGVIDQARVGTNGWYSGYICMHEPWQARIGTTIDDPAYTRSESEWLDYAQAHAIKPDGMVMSRWYYTDGDAPPGTFDEKTGFYEAQWGRLMDSQTSYVWNVADQFDQTGDLDWVRKHKTSCEAALDYLLRRDSNGNGLVEMENSLISQKRSSDWLDIVWAGYENAFVNAQLYGALNRWASVESVLGDSGQAARLTAAAAKLKATFNKPISEGGFWDPDKGWYAYWRDADGSIHGDNLTVEVNLTAVADGLCDDPRRRARLLDTIEARMNKEKLLVWPACFDSYAPGEGMDDKFPKYENGDIFLSWAEYGVKAYASYRPEIALKYVKQLVDQYNKDGLAFQRYLRADGKGAGDDILAGNCNVITGLYRDIYGIQPKYNRLLIDPHIAPDLDGTVVKYNFRRQPLTISYALSGTSGGYTVEHEGLKVSSSNSFGIDFVPGSMTFFEGVSNQPSLTIDDPSHILSMVKIGGWAKDKLLTATANRAGKVKLAFPTVQPGEHYVLLSPGLARGSVTAEDPTLTITCKPGNNELGLYKGFLQ